MRDTVPPCETTGDGGAPEPTRRRPGRPRRPTPADPTSPNGPQHARRRFSGPSRTTPHPPLPPATKDPAPHTRKTPADTPRNNLPLRRGAAPCAGWALTRTPGGDLTWTTPYPATHTPAPGLAPED